MHKLKLMVLTDHTNHNKENSLYQLIHALREHPICGQVDIASMGIIENHSFFYQFLTEPLFATRVDKDFAFHPNGIFFKGQLRRVSLENYDVVLLRIPPPVENDFVVFLEKEFPRQIFINRPNGIFETGTKEYLMNFPELCPPMKICRTIDDIIEFKERFPIVLKPFREYGGKGIVKIDGEKVWEGVQQTSFKEFSARIEKCKIEYLGVKFLNRVSLGDKRIVVINGEIIGASLRKPAKDSWLCNVAMGGNSNWAKVNFEEIRIVKRINSELLKKGILMYGIDTLENDDKKRVLSEINTTSIGGLPQIANLTGKPILKVAAELIWNFVVEKKSGGYV